jgi:hypothetical protein
VIDDEAHPGPGPEVVTAAKLKYVVEFGPFDNEKKVYAPLGLTNKLNVPGELKVIP